MGTRLGGFDKEKKVANRQIGGEGRGGIVPKTEQVRKNVKV